MLRRGATGTRSRTVRRCAVTQFAGRIVAPADDATAARQRVSVIPPADTLTFELASINPGAITRSRQQQNAHSHRGGSVSGEPPVRDNLIQMVMSTFCRRTGGCGCRSERPVAACVCCVVCQIVCQAGGAPSKDRLYPMGRGEHAMGKKILAFVAGIFVLFTSGLVALEPARFSGSATDAGTDDVIDVDSGGFRNRIIAEPPRRLPTPALHRHRDQRIDA